MVRHLCSLNHRYLNMLSRKFNALALASVAFSASISASARPSDDNYDDDSYEEHDDESSNSKLDPVRLEALIGYGVHTEDSDMNGFGVGMGIRGGYVFNGGFYAGGTYVRHLGETKSLSFGPTSIDINAYIDYFAAELGYEIPTASNIALRPYGALGSAGAHASVGDETESSDRELMFMLGFDVSAALSKHVYIGGDIRYLDIIEPEVGGIALFTRIGGAF